MKIKNRSRRFLPYGLLLVLVLYTNCAIAQTPSFRSMISVSKDKHEIKAYTYPTRSEKVKVHKNRTYHFYYHKDIHQNQGGYTGYLLHGPYQVTNDLRQMIQQGEFKNGVKNGIWKEWAGNGILSAVSHWKNGRQHGKLEIYDNNGRLSNVQRYRQGKAKGEMVVYQNGKKMELPKGEKKKKTKKQKKKQRKSRIHE